MITLQADVNHLDAQGRLRLGDLRMHQQTPFAQITAKNESILFVDGEDVVRGELIHDPQYVLGRPIHLSQPILPYEAYPPAAAAR